MRKTEGLPYLQHVNEYLTAFIYQLGFNTDEQRVFIDYLGFGTLIAKRTPQSR